MTPIAQIEIEDLSIPPIVIPWWAALIAALVLIAASGALLRHFGVI